MKTIVILGANGRLSNMTAKAFYAAGFNVIAVTRSGFAENLPAGILHRAADALDLDALIEATRGADVIFNGLNPIYTKWREMALPMAKNVLAAAKTHNATHLFPGNVYNYGTEITVDMKPEDASSPSVGKGSIRIQMEDLFEQAAKKDNIKTVILRAGDFFGGPIRGSWFDLILATKINKGVLTYPGPMNLPHAWAYLPDLAQAFVALANKADEFSNFERFNFAGFTVTGDEMLAYMKKATETPLKRAGFPWPVLKIGGLFNGMWREVSEMSYLWFTAHSLDGKKLNQAVGVLENTDIVDALRNSLAQLEVSSDCKKTA